MPQGYLDKNVPGRQTFIQRYRIPIVVLACITLIVSALIGTKIFFDYQATAKANASAKLISALRKEALQARANDDLDNAENLYGKALAEAIDAKLPMDALEFLSRLVQIEIKKDELAKTKDLVQLAVTIACKVKDASNANSSLSVWLDDMANAFYSRGERSTDEVVKKFCMERYLDIKLPTEDKYDRFLAGRAMTLTGYLDYNGSYLEAVPYWQMYFDYNHRTHPGDASIMPGMYLQLGALYLMVHKTQEADAAFKKFSEFNKGYKTLLDEGLANVYFGQLCEQENKLHEAKILYKKAIQQCTQHFNGAPIFYTGRCIAVLGLLEQRLGNNVEAKKLLQESLDCYNKSWIPPITPENECLHGDGWVYSGQVFCMERLSEIALKEGNKSLSQSLKSQAKKIREKNPHWASCKNPDPNYVYLVGGLFPSGGGEIIPTHIKFPP